MTTRSAPLHLRIFISSPGDVADERGIALQLFERLQYDPLLRGRVTIEAVAWDKPGGDAPLLATMTPQEAINQGLLKPSETEIVVVIFWARMGTPLPDDYLKPDGTRYLSGTEWEYIDAMQAALKTGVPKIVVYRRSEDVAFSPKDPNFAQKVEQWQRVDVFFAAFNNPPNQDYTEDSRNSVAVSPDGKQIASVVLDKALLWDVATGQIIRTFVGHSGLIYDLAFSPDGQYLLTGGGNRIAILWDVATGQPIRAFSGHTFNVLSVAFSPDGKLIVTGQRRRFSSHLGREHRRRYPCALRPDKHSSQRQFYGRRSACADRQQRRQDSFMGCQLSGDADQRLHARFP